MFRSLFGSLFTSRPQVRARSRVSFKPQLEALEHRYAPSSYHSSSSGTDIHAVQIVKDDNNVTAQQQVASPGATQIAVNLQDVTIGSSMMEHHKGS